MANNYRDSVNGMTVVPTVGTVAKYGRLYASADVVAGTIIFGDGTTLSNFPIIKGYHPLWVKSVTNASIANTLYVATQDRV